ncbi:MAG: family 78 glycoside hydrolase catalytic domain [Clostridia bacterium]|nr:family 78 glycoside hydrolase catalytic domain [Clostridia bacterium]
MSNYIWTGSWIGCEMTVEDRFAPLFKKQFSVSDKIKSAKAYICGLGLFELKINGYLPDDTVLNPAHSQYSKTVLYRVFDVTELLASGENTVTVEVGHSFLNETTDVWDWHKASWRSAPKLIMNLVIEYESGKTETIATDESWLVTADGPTVANSIYLGETYDARRTACSWKNAVCVEPPKGKLKEQYMPPIRRISEFRPEKIERLSDGSIIVTAPEMVTGWAKIKIDAPEGTEIFVTYGEKLTSDGHVQKIGKTEGHGCEWWPDAYIQHDCFISGGEPFEFEPKFSYKGFRYFQIDNHEKDISAHDISIYRTANDVETISDFTCSNELINKLHVLMHRTLLNNFQGKPTDTPVWEKNGWLGDANCALPIMMYNFDMSDYMASFVDIMDDCWQEYGSVPVIVPSADWSTENSPVWNTIFVFAAEALINFCNKTDYAEKLYPDLKAFAEKDIDELCGKGWIWDKRGLADWVSPMGEENMEIDPGSSEGCEICGTAFIYGMLKSMVNIAKELGKNEDIAVYESAMAEIYKAFNQNFYRPDAGIYETNDWHQKGKRTKYRQTSNLLPLYFGLVPEEYKEKVAENLINDFVCRDFHFDTGCTGTRFVLPVLFELGRSDIAYKILTQTTYPSWGFWVENGANSAWESWERTTRSQNHYFLATYDEALYSYIAGIKNIRRGYENFTVAPVLDCGLEFANVKINSPKGTIRCEWHKTENGFEVEIEIPEGSDADIILKCGKNEIRTVQSGKTEKYILCTE